MHKNARTKRLPNASLNFAKEQYLVSKIHRPTKISNASHNDLLLALYSLLHLQAEPDAWTVFALERSHQQSARPHAYTHTCTNFPYPPCKYPLKGKAAYEQGYATCLLACRHMYRTTIYHAPHTTLFLLQTVKQVVLDLRLNFKLLSPDKPQT